MTNADEPLIPAMKPKVVRCTHCRALHLGWGEDGEPVSPGELVDPAVARERARIVEALREAAHGGNRGQPGSFWVGWRAAARAIEQAAVSGPAGGCECCGDEAAIAPPGECCPACQRSHEKLCVQRIVAWLRADPVETVRIQCADMIAREFDA